MAALFTLALKPLAVCKSVFMFSLTLLLVMIQTWIDLVKTAISVHLDILRKTIICTIALVALPERIVTALQRERLLEQNLHEMQNVVSDLVHRKNEVQNQLQIAIKEREILESILAEFDEENDRVIAQIELLEHELRHLKVENLQLKAIQRKDLWDFKDDDISDNTKNTDIARTSDILYGIPSWRSDYEASKRMMHKDAWGTECKSKEEVLIPGCFSQQMDRNESLNRRRKAASQSLFSAVLSLLVGMIIWEAEDPCVPLVVALFGVVVMSLQSVVQLFSNMRNRPASDAVVLLSLNWFILGALTYPTLPKDPGLWTTTIEVTKAS
ncbi:hypothetical protein K2173_009506 [Erythroxylum novogranatense]|uniref:Uncharacterized protein n=1 Tax=Erythroxylum novogranatense TaxID=1862640 RepID=A0AAV8U807_9ROSI|nr:hypothetical protein K2173_009506 [Erythroxylum novogranatense]